MCAGSWDQHSTHLGRFSIFLQQWKLALVFQNAVKAVLFFRCVCCSVFEPSSGYERDKLYV
jgi:hypothetical protein